METTSIIKIEIDQSIIQKSIQNVAQLTNEIDKLKVIQKKQKEEGKELTAEYIERNAQIAALTKEQRQNNEVLKQANTITMSAVGSNEELRAQLSLLTKQYNGLSKEERENTDAGVKLKNQVKAISDELKKNEGAVGDNRRSVGSYKEAMTSVFDTLKKSGGSFGTAISGVQGFNTALSANPIGAVIQLISALVNALKGNAEVADFVARVTAGMNKVFHLITDTVVNLIKPLKAVFENPKQAIIDLIDLIKNNLVNRFKAFGVIVDAIANKDLKGLTNGLIQLGTGVENSVDKIAALGSALVNAGDEGFSAAKKLDEFTVSQARMNAQMKLNEKQIAALERDLKNVGLTFEERKKIAEELADLEIANAQLAQQTAKEVLDAEELKLKGKSLTAEEEAKLIELTTDVQLAAEDEKIAAAQRSKRIALLLKGEEAEARNSDAAKAAKDAKDAADKELKAEADRLEALKKQFDDAMIEQSKARKDFADERQLAGLNELEKEKVLLDRRVKELMIAGVEEVDIQKFIAAETARIQKAAAEKSKELLLERIDTELQINKNRIDAEVGDESIKAIAINELELAALVQKKKILDAEVAATGVATQQQVLQETDLNAQIAALEEATAKRKQDLALAAIQGTFGVAQDLLGMLQSTAQMNIKAIEDQAKAAGKTQEEIDDLTLSAKKEAKDLAVAAAIIQTFQSAISAYSSAAAVPIVGVALAPIAAAAALVFGFKQVDAIKNQKLATGGIVKAARGAVFGRFAGRSHSEGGNKYTGEDGSQIEVEKDEIFAVVNKRSSALIQNLSDLNELGGGVSFAKGGLVDKFAGGGVVNSIASGVFQQEDNTRNLASQLSGLVPVLVIEEFESVQGRKVQAMQNLQI